MVDLRSVLLRECSAEVRSALAPRTDLEGVLQQRLEAAREAWPTIDLDAETFVTHLAAALPADAQLDRLHVSDLYLATAASTGSSSALAAFEDAFFGEIRPVARRVSESIELDELRQELRTRLFVAEESRPPRIAGYDGRGELRNWFRVIVMRTALNRQRRGRADRLSSTDDDLLEHVLPSATGPELEPYKTSYATSIRDAVTVAIGALEVRDRLVLRYSVVDRLSLQDIGTLLGVHKSSAHRRVAHARDRLFEATRRELEQTMDVRGEELDAVIALALSRVELSLSRILPP